MAVVVFDSDVLIGFLYRDDAHHAEAVTRVRASIEPGTRRAICAVNYVELLIGPLRAGTDQIVRETLARLSIEVIAVDAQLADRAGRVRADTNLKLPDAFAVATALSQSAVPGAETRLESFDQAVISAYRQLA